MSTWKNTLQKSKSYEILEISNCLQFMNLLKITLMTDRERQRERERTHNVVILVQLIRARNHFYIKLTTLNVLKLYAIQHTGKHIKMLSVFMIEKNIHNLKQTCKSIFENLSELDQFYSIRIRGKKKDYFFLNETNQKKRRKKSR